jgi:L-lactate dehydrogenase complex protein LldG
MSRAAIIGNIQRGLKRGPLPADQQAMLLDRMAKHPRHLIPARAPADVAGRVAWFAKYVEQEFGTVDVLDSYDAVPAAVVKYLAAHNLAPALVAAPHPALQAIKFDHAPLLQVRFGTAAPSDTVSLQHAFAGIAETGTLMMPSGAASPTSNNLLPDDAIVVLPAGRITGCYEEAFDMLRAEFAVWPRNIMLVTGPSRSADVEQTLELGAHGPRRLHVIIIHEGK